MSPWRFWLGMAQMGTATTAMVLLFATGVSAVTVAASSSRPGS